MGRKRGGGLKVKARKKVTVKLLERMHAGQITTPYRIMERIVKEYHPHLKEAKIAIAWRFGKRADADGRLWLGQAKKGSDLDRSMHGYDFVILLNHEAWNNSSFTEDMMNALIDHELCHCAISVDSSGEPKVDEDGRKVYRIRKHDLEEFSEIVARHGQWKADIRHFIECALRDQKEARDRPLLKDSVKTPPATAANGKAHESNGHHKANGDWRKTPLESLFEDTVAKAFKRRGIATLGGFADWTNKGKKVTDIDGIGPKTAEAIDERLAKFWKEHPEYADDKPAIAVT